MFTPSSSQTFADFLQVVIGTSFVCMVLSGIPFIICTVVYWTTATTVPTQCLVTGQTNSTTVGDKGQIFDKVIFEVILTLYNN